MKFFTSKPHPQGMDDQQKMIREFIKKCGPGNVPHKAVGFIKPEPVLMPVEASAYLKSIGVRTDEDD